MKIYSFRNCVLNTLERNVLQDGKRVNLTPRTFDVLQLLVERSGEILTKDEILNTVWGGNLVEESNLPVHIAKLRRSLDESDAARFIETVHGIGYRFVAPILRLAPSQAEPHIAHSLAKESGLPADSVTRSELENAIVIFIEAAENIRQLLPKESTSGV